MSNHIFSCGDEVSYKGKLGIVFMERYNGRYDLHDPEGDGPHQMLAKDVPESDLKPVTSARWYSPTLHPEEGQRVLWKGRNRSYQGSECNGAATFRAGKYEDDEHGDDLDSVHGVTVEAWMPFPL